MQRLGPAAQGGVVRHGQLEADGHGWWVWTCLAGVILGILGYSYLQRIYSRERDR